MRLEQEVEALKQAKTVTNNSINKEITSMKEEKDKFGKAANLAALITAEDL